MRRRERILIKKCKIMYGFTITKDLKHINHSERIIENNGFLCENNMIRKFENDKIFFEDDNYIVILDGFIFNKNELLKDEWFATIIKLYEENGDDFFQCLRGTFGGGVI